MREQPQKNAHTSSYKSAAKTPTYVEGPSYDDVPPYDEVSPYDDPSSYSVSADTTVRL